MTEQRKRSEAPRPNRERALRIPPSLRYWLADDSIQDRIKSELAEHATLLRRRVHEIAAEEHQLRPDVPEELIRIAVARILEEAMSDLVAWEAALSRYGGTGWSWSAIAVAAGLNTTTNPRYQYPTIEALVEADQWAYENPGKQPPPVEGKSLMITVDSYQDE